MSVSIRIFKEGKVIEDKIFPGEDIKPVLDYLQENEIDYRVDKDAEDLYEITKNNKELTIMCIDNMNVLGAETTANFYSEYLVDYEKKIYTDILRILNG